MNLPNKLTVLRMALIPVVMFFYLAEFIPLGIGKITALVIFILAAITDLLDGKIARKYNLVTNLGKFLDPIADKLLVAAALIALVGMNRIPSWFVTVVIAREFIVTGIRLVAAVLPVTAPVCSVENTTKAPSNFLTYKVDLKTHEGIVLPL